MKGRKSKYIRGTVPATVKATKTKAIYERTKTNGG
jgi:hypothetical protein